MKDFLTKEFWLNRITNKLFWVQVFLSLTGPVLVYFGLSFDDFDNWPMLGSTIQKALLNPYIVGTMLVGLWNAVNNPTTPGLGDSVTVKEEV